MMALDQYWQTQQKCDSKTPTQRGGKIRRPSRNMARGAIAYGPLARKLVFPVDIEPPPRRGGESLAPPQRRAVCRAIHHPEALVAHALLTRLASRPPATRAILESLAQHR